MKRENADRTGVSGPREPWVQLRSELCRRFRSVSTISRSFHLRVHGARLRVHPRCAHASGSLAHTAAVYSPISRPRAVGQPPRTDHCAVLLQLREGPRVSLPRVWTSRVAVSWHLRFFQRHGQARSPVDASFPTRLSEPAGLCVVRAGVTEQPASRCHLNAVPRLRARGRSFPSSR